MALTWRLKSGRLFFLAAFLLLCGHAWAQSATDIKVMTAIASEYPVLATSYGWTTTGIANACGSSKLFGVTCTSNTITGLYVHDNIVLKGPPTMF